VNRVFVNLDGGEYVCANWVIVVEFWVDVIWLKDNCGLVGLGLVRRVVILWLGAACHGLA
jgi:hypothetical protein